MKINFLHDHRHTLPILFHRPLSRIKHKRMETTNSLSSRALQYYVIARKWGSDLEFYKFETGFLRTLLDDYYFNVQHKDGRADVLELNRELMKLDADKNQLEKALDEQIRHLELMSEDVVPEDVSWLAGKQIRLEYMVTNIFSEYKELKKKIFCFLQKPGSQNNLVTNMFLPN